MKKEKTLHEQKVEMKGVWEECFKIKMEDKLTEEGVKKFWSDDFSLKECGDLLTEAGIDHAVGGIIDGILGDLGDLDLLKGAKGIAVIALDDDDEKTCECSECKCSKPEGKEEEKFRVVRCDYVLDEKFNTIEEAREFIKNESCTTTYTIDDFSIIKVI